MRTDRSPRSRVGSLRQRSYAALLVTAVLVPAVLIAPGATAPRSVAADPAVVTDWNAVAVETIATDAGKANAESWYWFAFEQVAVYNAVVGITRRYELYRWNVRGPRMASPEAAAAAAAHRVLMTYFPASEPRLSAAYAGSLANIPDGVAERLGVRYGERAASHLIDLRADDGRFADVTFDMPPDIGVWRPTPPTFTPFFDPWLSQLDPFTMASPDQFRPGPPPVLTSAAYTRDYNEVKEYGSKTDSARSAAQTETALLFSDTGVGPLQAALRDVATRHELDISDSARLFAAVEMSAADAIIASWDGKMRYGFWRPVTAIQMGEDDGNPDTVGDPVWEPLIPTPPYPDYPSGLAPVIGAVSGALAGVLDLGGGRIDLYLTSVAAGVTRHFEFASDMNRDVVDARVWLGIHFRTADVVGSEMGVRIADWALEHFFGPTH